MKKVLITDYVHPHLIKGLKNLGYKVSYDKDISLGKTKKCIADFEGVIINSKTVMDKHMIDKASKLEFIGRLGSGLEIIDLAYAKEKKIKVYNSPEGNRNAVAEHALGMLLALANNLVQSDNEVKAFKWSREKNRGFELEGKKIGIIGYGNTGSSFAKLLGGFDVKILVYDKYKKIDNDKTKSLRAGSLKYLLKNADIISLHVPLTDETFELIDDDFIEQCKDGVILINTSRGKVIDIPALTRGLQSNKISGACLDVLPNEKPKTYSAAEKKSYQRLFKSSKLILSPHVAGWTHESLFKIADVLLKKISRKRNK